MNREIKFRAWDSVKKQMVEISHMSFPHNNISGLLNGLPWSCDGADLGTKIFLMQYTGLKDKNGKEAYSNDIVSDGINEPFVVDLWNWHLMIRLSEIEFEIIGNLFENPELLKPNK